MIPETHNLIGMKLILDQLEGLALGAGIPQDKIDAARKTCEAEKSDRAFRELVMGQLKDMGYW